MKAQGLPITTVVLIIICIVVLAVVTLFFFSGMSSGQGSVSGFQCQQICGTINTIIQAKQMCSTQSTDIAKISSVKSFCSGKCDKKITCTLPNIDNGCGYDRLDPTITSTCLICDANLNPGINTC